MTTGPIQQTHELLEGSIRTFVRDCQPDEDDESLRAALYYLMKLGEKCDTLIAEAERWQAMAIGERAHRVAYENNVPLSEYRDRAMCYAARELRAESSSWRKIGPVERVALEIATGDRPLTDDIFYLDKLKKLLEGT